VANSRPNSQGSRIIEIWCCHVDLSAPDPKVWNFLKPYIEYYQTAVFSLPEYAQDLKVPLHFIMPAINPFSMTNKDMAEAEIGKTLQRYGISRPPPAHGSEWAGDSTAEIPSEPAGGELDRSDHIAPG
jgi:hypothetical protein